jgi:uncharacterized protein (TIGR02246 family)
MMSHRARSDGQQIDFPEDVMISSRLKAVLCVLALVSVSVSVSWARNQSKGSDADTAAVKQTMENFVDAFNLHDAHAAAMMFTEDADLTNMRGASSHGRNDIEALYNTIFTTRLKNARETHTIKNIRFVTPNVVQVDAEWEMTGAMTEDGKAIPLRKGTQSPLLVKQNGKWMIATFHESEFVIPPAK